MKKVVVVLLLAMFFAGAMQFGPGLAAAQNVPGLDVAQQAKIAADIETRWANRTEVPVQRLDAYLRQHGYPDDVIRMMDHDWKLRSYMFGAEYISGSDVDGMSQQLTSEVTPMSVSDVLGRCNVEKLSQSSWAQNIFVFTYTWDWNEAPATTFTDLFGMTWNPEFRPLANSSGTGYLANWWYNPDVQYGSQIIYKYPLMGGTNCVAAINAPCGVEFKYNIVNGFTVNGSWHTVIANHGQGQIYAFMDTPSGMSGQRGPTVSVCGRYFHQTISFGFSASLTYGRPISIGIAPTGGSVYVGSSTAGKDFTGYWTWE